jgi:hypothetical protein
MGDPSADRFFDDKRVDHPTGLLIFQDLAPNIGDPGEIEQKILEKRKVRRGWGDILPKGITLSRE